MDVAMIGLGAMGRRMAARLLAAGHEVTVWNRSEGPARELADLGAKVAGSPRDAVRGQAVVIAMVRDDEASRAVWMGDTGALAGLAEGTIAIESSTLTPGWIEELGAAVAARGGRFLDAPVAGSRPQAEAGALIHLVGGEADAVEAAAPVLGAMGGALHHVGAVGSGAAMKLLVNAWFGVQVAALAELLALSEKVGLGAARAMDVLAATPLTAPGLAGAGGAIVARKWGPLFPIELVTKDFGYAAGLAQRSEAEVPLVEAARARFEAARAAGHGGDNITGVVQLY